MMGSLAVSRNRYVHDFQLVPTCFLLGRVRSSQVNVDNNCVGFYQSMYLGSFCTQTLIDNQFSYQVRSSDCALQFLVVARQYGVVTQCDTVDGHPGLGVLRFRWGDVSAGEREGMVFRHTRLCRPCVF